MLVASVTSKVIESSCADIVGTLLVVERHHLWPFYVEM